MLKDKTISIIIPIMNEEKNIKLILERLKKVLANYAKYEIIFVDDGSIDNSLNEIIKFSDKNIKYISFSRNFGHQNALKAGIDACCGDCAISLDGDLQHPPEFIPKLIEKWIEGYDIVNTIRQDDESQGFLKRFTSNFFYKLINFISETKITPGSADFRLIDKKVIEILRNIHESPIFFRGLIPWLGFKQIGLEYVPEKRLHGVTKYSLSKMISFAILGITSFSILPLVFAFKLGIFFFVLFLLSLILAFFTLIVKVELVFPIVIFSITLLLFSIQLFILGTIGAYLGKILGQVRNRPSYIIKSKKL